MPSVVIDSNILIGDFTLKGAHVNFLFNGGDRCGISIFVPEIVVDEVVGNYAKEAKRNASRFAKFKKNLESLGIEVVAPKVEVNERIDEYASFLPHTLRDKDVELVPYPSISARELVKASYEGKKPYKTSGDGFKDHLVFESVLTVASWTKDDVWFLTANHRDFCDADMNLHPELADLVPEGVKIRVIRSLHEFNNSIITPNLEKLDELAEQILAGEFTGFNPSEDLWEILHGELCETPYILPDLELPLDEPSGQYIDFCNADELTVNRLDVNELLIEVRGTLSLEVFGFINKSNLSTLSDDELENVSISDPEWNEGVVAATSMVELSFVLTAIFGESENCIGSVSVDVEASDF